MHWTKQKLAIWMASTLSVGLAFIHFYALAKDPVEVHPFSVRAEHSVILEISAPELQCPSQDVPPVLGFATTRHGSFRFFLHPLKKTIRIVVGYYRVSMNSEPAAVYLEDSPCSVGKLQISDSQSPSLELRHLPYIVARPDQILENPLNDYPIAVSVSRLEGPTEGGFRLRYTVYFTDEDSITSSEGTDSQMARYGRRTDIEWAYEVEYDVFGKILGRRFHTDVAGGVGHATGDFKGAFLSDGTSWSSENPVLYQFSSHNIFRDQPPTREVMMHRNLGTMLLPEAEIPSPYARELVQMYRPWMLQLSDQELAREGKLSRTSDEYLYLLLEGTEYAGAIRARVTFTHGESGWTESGGGNGNLDRFGEDLWEQQAYTAIPISPNVLEAIEAGLVHGRITFRSVNFVPFLGKFKLDQGLFFRRLSSGEFAPVDITHRLRCWGEGLLLTCRF